MNKPKLLNVLSRRATNINGTTDMELSVDFGNGPETIPFTYVDGDKTGLTLEVDEWLDSNTIALDPFVEPAIETLIPQAKQQVVQFANEITSSILSQYPEAEQRLWPDFQREALAFDQVTPSNNDVQDFPVLVNMLTAKSGPPANDQESIDRLVTAVPGIITNAQIWVSIAEYVSGLRGRVFTLLEAATNQAEIDQIIADAKIEAETVAASYGLI